ncbi:MAG: ferritin-like domain-containing protein [Armatimonadota bacterium]|nr:ferritin-like domain-containing protein [Armatimonadota bacterium]
MKMNTLDDLLMHELEDLRSAEVQLIEALPKVAEAANSAPVRKAFEEHLKVTKTHLDRIDQAFEAMGKKPNGHECAAMKGLIKECSEVTKLEGDPNVLDAALIAAAQRIEHYEIAGYGTARAHATECGHDEVATLLQETRNEEVAANETLTNIAVTTVNKKAGAASAQ